MFSINRSSEIDVNQLEHDEMDNEDDLLQIERSDDDLNESGKI